MIFKAENFSLDPNADGYELDQEVAARIATRLYIRDPDCQAGNNYADTPVIVDPTGWSDTHRLHYPDEVANGVERDFRVSFYGTDQQKFNQYFGTEVAKGLLDGERSNRLGLAGSLGTTALFAAIPFAVAAPAIEASHASNSDTVYIAGAATVAWLTMARPMPKHLYRLNVVKPGSYLNRRYLKAAGHIAEGMKLPPVVTVTR